MSQQAKLYDYTTCACLPICLVDFLRVMLNVVYFPLVSSDLSEYKQVPRVHITNWRS